MTEMKMTKLNESILLQSFDGVTNGGALISRVGDAVIRWHYRWSGAVCDARDDADCITLEYDRSGTIELETDLNAEAQDGLAEMISQRRSQLGDMTAT